MEALRAVIQEPNPDLAMLHPGYILNRFSKTPHFEMLRVY